nr:hypothetical protein BaRGS_019743 [Batillaria attramentaria]
MQMPSVACLLEDDIDFDREESGEDMDMVPKILDLLHIGHFGMERMKQLARTAVYWPDLKVQHWYRYLFYYYYCYHYYYYYYYCCYYYNYYYCCCCCYCYYYYYYYCHYCYYYYHYYYYYCHYYYYYYSYCKYY